MLLWNNMANILFLFMCTLAGVHSLSVAEVSAPSPHKAGEPLTLNCDYSYEESESSQLVLTWYFNESPIPIYQWVPSLDVGPQVIHEMFKDNLDLTHEADQDKFKKHSALSIINPDTRFAGNYKCRVSTFTKEVTHSKDVSIFVPPPSINLTYSQGVISCGVEGVYPPPTIVLAWTYNSTVFYEDNMEIVPNSMDENLFDASIVAIVDEADISFHDIMTCEVTLADGAYEERVEENIFQQKVLEDDATVYLVEEQCNSPICGINEKDAVDDSYPVDTEQTDNTFDVGVGIESFSGEAAGFVQSSGSSIFYIKTVILFTILLYFTL